MPGAIRRRLGDRPDHQQRRRSLSELSAVSRNDQAAGRRRFRPRGPAPAAARDPAVGAARRGPAVRAHQGRRREHHADLTVAVPAGLPDLPARRHPVVRRERGQDLRRRRPGRGAPARLVPARLPAGRRLHAGPVARGDDRGGRDRLAVRFRPARDPAPRQRGRPPAGQAGGPAAGRGGPAHDPGRGHRGARLGYLRVLLALPASRPGHAAAGGRVRGHGHRAPLPAAAGPPARATGRP